MDASTRYRQIADEIARGAPVFPTHAEVSLRVKRALDDEDCSVEQAARLIQADPLLAARVIAVANAAAYNRSGRAITDLRQAVSRLGFRTLRSLALAMLVRALPGPPAAPAQAATAGRLWTHTVHVAALAQVLARRVTRQDPEAALFAGIVHEMAGFYLLARARETPELLTPLPEAWQEEGEAVVGDALLRALDIPETIVGAVRALWQGYLAIPPASLGDTLLLAEALSPVPSPLYWAPEGEAQAGSPHLEIQLDEQTLSNVLAESAEEVRTLIDALR